MTADAKTGVILLNLGGPDTLRAVRPFLYNLFSDREIIRLGPSDLFQKPLAWLISTLRAPKARGYYSQIGGGSPILKITMEQARLLETELSVSGYYRVYVGMRYWRPYIKDALAQAKSDGMDRVIGLSMYPHYSRATTGSSESALKSALIDMPLPCAFARPYYDHPMYIDALADLINKAGVGADTMLLFSAHSLPVSFIEEGDPYVRHILATIAAVTAKINAPYRIGYQSRSGPVKWLTPATEDVIKEAAKEGVKDLLMVPISFVSDHIETLYEIDILYKRLAGGLGMGFRRTESLNTHPMFIAALKDAALRAVEDAGDWR